MSGSRSGGLKVKAAMEEKYGKDYYSNIGKKGGVGDRGARADKGFGSMDKQKHLAASRKGGKRKLVDSRPMPDFPADNELSGDINLKGAKRWLPWGK